MDAPKQSIDTLFILLGAIMVLAMHAGFAFLELGTVREKNQVNALVKILVDFCVSALAYFLVGFTIAYGTSLMLDVATLSREHGYELVKFFFLLTFAAAVPAIVSGGIAERARFGPQLIATAVIVGIIYPIFEGAAWNQLFGLQHWLKAATGKSSMISRGRWWSIRSADGLRSRRCCSWAHDATVTGATVALPRTRPRAFRSSRWAPGC